jgi:hypothetical protein
MYAEVFEEGELQFTRDVPPPFFAIKAKFCSYQIPTDTEFSGKWKDERIPAFLDYGFDFDE